MIRKLWSEVRDHTDDEISTGARSRVKQLIEKRVLDEFEDLIRCRPRERSKERQGCRNGFYARGLLTVMGHIPRLRIQRARHLKFRSRFFRGVSGGRKRSTWRRSGASSQERRPGRAARSPGRSPMPASPRAR
jgi:hypothetical protein